MLMTAIKSVFNFYMLCVQPLLGLFLVGYSIWSFSLIVVCPVMTDVLCLFYCLCSSANVHKLLVAHNLISVLSHMHHYFPLC